MYYRVLLDESGYYAGFYQKFFTKEDADQSNIGDITVDDLPPYLDDTKAMSCRYEDGNWIFDQETYAALIQKEKEAKEAEEKQQNTPTNDELQIKLEETNTVLQDIVETVIPNLIEGLESELLEKTSNAIISKLAGE